MSKKGNPLKTNTFKDEAPPPGPLESPIPEKITGKGNFRAPGHLTKPPKTSSQENGQATVKHFRNRRTFPYPPRHLF